MNDDKRIAAEKIKSLVIKYLDGDINRLPEFKFSKLWNDNEFGCPGRERLDSDDTELMRAIYVLIFSDIWPGLTLESLANYEYRGDTLNTYNTLFGSPYKQYNYSKSKHPGIDKFNPTDELSNKAINFRFGIYFTLGNMALLPNRQLNGTTINRYRGCNHTHDFFDRFLVDFKAVLVCEPKCDENLLALINHNGDCFEPFRNTGGFRNIITCMFLEDYVDAEYNPIVVSKAYYFWMRGDGYSVTYEEYLVEAERHLDFSTKVIKNRGKKMLDAIKNQFSLHCYEDMFSISKL